MVLLLAPLHVGAAFVCHWISTSISFDLSFGRYRDRCVCLSPTNIVLGIFLQDYRFNYWTIGVGLISVKHLIASTFKRNCHCRRTIQTMSLIFTRAFRESKNKSDQTKICSFLSSKKAKKEKRKKKKNPPQPPSERRRWTSRRMLTLFRLNKRFVTWRQKKTNKQTIKRRPKIAGEIRSQQRGVIDPPPHYPPSLPPTPSHRFPNFSISHCPHHLNLNNETHDIYLIVYYPNITPPLLPTQSTPPHYPHRYPPTPSPRFPNFSISHCPHPLNLDTETHDIYLIVYYPNITPPTSNSIHSTTLPPSLPLGYQLPVHLQFPNF